MDTFFSFLDSLEALLVSRKTRAGLLRGAENEHHDAGLATLEGVDRCCWLYALEAVVVLQLSVDRCYIGLVGGDDANIGGVDPVAMGADELVEQRDGDLDLLQVALGAIRIDLAF